MAEFSLNLDTLLRKKDNVVILVIIVVSLVAARSIYQNQVGRYNVIKLQIDAEKGKGASLDRIIVFNEKIKKAKEKSWDTVDVNAIIDRIYNIGLESAIKIRNISPAEKRDEKNYTLIPFTINCEATYRELVFFAKKLETYPMLIRIKNMDMSPMGEKADARNMKLRATVMIEAVYLK